MKKINTLLLLVLFVQLNAQNTYVPDDNFEQALIDLGYDSGALDNYVPTANINTITTLDVSLKNITDLTGIKDFVALSDLNCSRNQLNTINLANNLALINFNCSDNYLTNINLRNNVNLETLDLNHNFLTYLDVSDNLALINLSVQSNQLIALDVSNNASLQYLFCPYNTNLATLNITGASSLRSLNCNYDQLNSLDASTNIALEIVVCSNNVLVNLTINNGHNTIISDFDIRNNPGLTCILVDDATYSATNWTNIDPQTSFSTVSCSPMTYVPDDNFEQALIYLGYDSGALDNQVPTANINTITNLNIANYNITDLTGIEDFVSLITLNCDNNNLSTISLDSLSSLRYLYCSHNQLSQLDVSQNSQLIVLYCGYNHLNNINLNNNTALRYFSCYMNNLTSLNLSTNTSLRSIKCQNNHLVSLNIKNRNNNAISNNRFITYNNPNLNCILVDNATWSTAHWTHIDNQTVFNNTSCGAMTYVPDNNFEQALIDLGYDSGPLDDYVPTASINMITNLNISYKNIFDLTGIEDFTALRYFNCDHNLLTSIDISSNANLYNFNCNYNQLTTIDVSNNLALAGMYCRYNQLTTIDVSNNLALMAFYCSYNQLSTIDISNNTNLISFNCQNNQLTTIDIFNNTNLTQFNCGENNITSIDASNNPSLIYFFCYNNQLTTLNIKNGNNTAIINGAFNTTYNSNLSCITVDDEAYSTTNWTNIDSQTIFSSVSCDALTYIADSNFEQALIDFGYDAGALDHFVPTININTITYLNISSRNIGDLTGIQDFTALKTLNCEYNNLQYIDLSQLNELENIYCSHNQLTNLDVSQNLLLKVLYCGYNQLSLLDLSSNTALRYFSCYENNLISLDLSANTSLRSLKCQNNQLTSLNVKNGNNYSISNYRFIATNNPNLNCILVDDATWSTAHWTHIDSQMSFNAISCNITSRTSSNTTKKSNAINDKKASFEDAINIYPNPAKDNITITNNGSDTIDQITIYNALGAIVYQANTTQNSIDTSNFKTGVYLVQLLSDKKSLTKKLIIRK